MCVYLFIFWIGSRDPGRGIGRIVSCVFFCSHPLVGCGEGGEGGRGGTHSILDEGDASFGDQPVPAISFLPSQARGLDMEPQFDMRNCPGSPWSLTVMCDMCERERSCSDGSRYQGVLCISKGVSDMGGMA